VSPFLRAGDVDAGRVRMIFRMSSWRPRKTACVVDSMGVLVADIWVVAERNDLSQDETSSRASHSSLERRYGHKSL
jgi:hypothetical protein